MATPHTRPQPGARALYLGGTGTKHISHTQEALVVTHANGQTQRYPLARVARIVSSQAADWDGSALALCLKAGISITWADGKGQALGSALPSRSRLHHQTNHTLELLLEQPGGRQHHSNWLRSRRMHVLIEWGRTSATPISPIDWEMTKRQWVYQQQLHTHLPPGLLAHCQAWAVAQLNTLGLAPTLWDETGQDIHLAHDLAHLLWAEMNLCTGPLADTATGEAEHIALFERWIGAHGAALHMHLGALVRVAKASLAP